MDHGHIFNGLRIYCIKNHFLVYDLQNIFWSLLLSCSSKKSFGNINFKSVLQLDLAITPDPLESQTEWDIAILFQSVFAVNYPKKTIGALTSSHSFTVSKVLPELESTRCNIFLTSSFLPCWLVLPSRTSASAQTSTDLRATFHCSICQRRWHESFTCLMKSSQ